MQITLEIKDSALDKILYFLEHLKDDVTIVSQQENPKLEIIDENDPDFSYIIKARRRRDEGEKTYSIDEIVQEKLINIH